MLTRFYPILGAVAPLFYVSAVLLGGLLIPGYSHIYNTISEISVAPPSQRFVPEILFMAYNLTLLGFGIGALHYVRTPRPTLARIAFGLIVTSALLGIGMIIFRQDVRGAPTTLAGTLHIVLAGFTAPTTVVAALLMGLSLRQDPALRSWGNYSLGMSVFILVTGGLAAVSVGNDWSTGGLFERLTIGAFLLWLFTLATLTQRHAIETEWGQL